MSTLKVGKAPVGYDQFIQHGNGMLEASVTPSYTNKLTAGLYVVMAGREGQVFFIQKEVASDKLLTLPNMATNYVLDDLAMFWSKGAKDKYNDLGMLYKRGLLLFGKPGVGKTATITKICENVIAQDGLIIFNPSPQLLPEAISQLRAIEKAERKVLVVFEEFDHIVDDPSFLSLLDGELSTDNIAYIATTNHIDRIPNRIKNRPSRFARVLEIGRPSHNDRLVYIQTKLAGLFDDEYFTNLAKATEGLVLDQVKDVIVSTYVYGETLENALNKVKSLEDEHKDTSDDDTDDEIELEDQIHNISHRRGL